MFTSFLNSLKRPDNLSLIETIYKGYQTIFETKTNNWIKAYHGTNSEFDVFDENHFNTIEPKGDYTGSGFYFTNSKETAQKYAKQAVNKLGGKEIVKEVFLNIKNPFIINSKDDITKLNNLFHTVNSMADMPNLTEIEKNKLRDLGYERFKLIKENPKAVLDKFKSLGYDGIIDNLYGQIIVFSPNNIKSSPQDDKLISESIDVTFGKEPRGQTFDQITAYINGTNVARLVYELDFPIKGQINIELIETEPLYRKTGIATTLIQKLKEKYPDYQISGRSTNKIAEHLLKKTNVIDRTVQERKPILLNEAVVMWRGDDASDKLRPALTTEGIFFTPNKEYAEQYGKTKPYYLNIKNPFNLNTGNYQEIINAAEKLAEEAEENFINKKGEYPKWQWEIFGDVEEFYEKAKSDNLIKFPSSRAFTDLGQKWGTEKISLIMKKAGYDSFYNPFDEGYETYAILDPSQATAINNNVDERKPISESIDIDGIKYKSGSLSGITRII